jgi:hypothetical protein
MATFSKRTRGLDNQRQYGLASARAATLGGNTVQTTHSGLMDMRRREEGAANLRNYSLMAHQMRRQNKLDASAVKQQQFQNDITTRSERRTDAIEKENIAGSRQNREQSAEMHPERVKEAKITNEAGRVSIAGARQAQEQSAEMHPERVKEAKINNELGTVSIAGARQAQEQSAEMHPERVKEAKINNELGTVSIAGARQQQYQSGKLFEHDLYQREIQSNAIGDAVADAEQAKAAQKEYNEIYGQFSPQEKLDLMDRFRDRLRPSLGEGATTLTENELMEQFPGEWEQFVLAEAGGDKLAQLEQKVRALEAIGDKKGVKRAKDDLNTERYQRYQSQATSLLQRIGQSETAANIEAVATLLATGATPEEIRIAVRQKL